MLANIKGVERKWLGKGVLWGALTIALILAGIFGLNPQSPSPWDPAPVHGATPQFQIVDTRAEYGHLIVEVQHFNPDGSHWFFEDYTFQGREAYKHPRVTDQLGNSPQLRLFLKANGRVAPTRTRADGKVEHYLPAGSEWLRHSRPHLEVDTFLSVISQIHAQRLITGWGKGRYRLNVRPLDFTDEDANGAALLAARFAGLRNQAYVPQPGGTFLAYAAPPTDIPRGTAWGTISTFFPDADVESTSVDGEAARTTVDQTFADIRSGAGNASLPSASEIIAQLTANTTTNHFKRLRRMIFLFDTSALPDSDAIDSATMDFVATLSTNTYSETAFVALVTSTPASNTNIVDADYAQLGTVDQATDLNVASVTADSSTYNLFTLNSTGLGNISKTSITKFGMRLAFDADNSSPTWGSNHDAKTHVATAEEVLSGDKRPRLVVTHTAPSAAITGTVGDGATEQEVRDGAGTIIITLTGDTWVAAGGTFNAQRQAIINGLDAAESETAGWNAQVRDQIGVSSVVRTSSTVATITLTASEVASYLVANNEIITMTVPNAALVTSGSDITATPTFTITAALESAVITGTLGGSGGTPAEIVAGGETIIITLTNTTWVLTADFNAQRQAILNGLVSDDGDQNGWDSKAFAVGDVVRTSNTVVTITLTAESAYAIPSTEAVTTTPPAAAMVFGEAIAATPTFSIVATFVASGNRVTTAIDLSSVTDVAYCSLAWQANVPTNTTVTFDTSVNGGTSYTTGHVNGNCPAGITVGSSLSTITDFRIRVNLATTNSSVQPTVATLALVIEDDSGQELIYQLTTTPSASLADSSANSHTGTMSFPVAVTGVSASTDPLVSLREPLNTATAQTAPQVASAVSGAATSDNIFSTTETGFPTLPGQGIVEAIAGASDGLPTRFVWFIFIGVMVIGMGVMAIHFTQSLFLAALIMAAGLGFWVATGNGLMPGWVLFIFAPLAGSFILLRKGLPL